MTHSPDHAEPAIVAAGLGPAERDILDRLAQGKRLGLADRPEDRARQRLRKAGLIAYCGSPHRWQISAAGLAVRAALNDEGKEK